VGKSDPVFLDRDLTNHNPHPGHSRISTENTRDSNMAQLGLLPGRGSLPSPAPVWATSSLTAGRGTISALHEDRGANTPWNLVRWPFGRDQRHQVAESLDRQVIGDIQGERAQRRSL
jgi:hypothetical protein